MISRSRLASSRCFGLLTACTLFATVGCGVGNRDPEPDAGPPSDAGIAPDGTPEMDRDLPTGPDVERGTDCTPAGLAALEAELARRMDLAASDPSVSSVPDYTVMLEREDGHTLVHSLGNSSPTTSYESASTSKWVTAAVILDLVDQGRLSLTTTARSRMPLFWLESTVTLEHLLSFRSGFAEEPRCINTRTADFRSCVESIYSRNSATAPAVGSQFQYASTHLQVAGLMAINSVVGASSWGDVFSAFQARTGLFPSSTYDLPSATNPRLAGGMHWVAQDYFDFLRALYRGTVLSAASRNAMLENHRGAAVPTASPVIDQLGEDWAYGLGNWLECPGATDDTAFNCGSRHRNSSSGAYGAYPFIDFDHRYFGIVARQGSIGTFHEGVGMFRAVESLTAKWAANDCSP